MQQQMTPQQQEMQQMQPYAVGAGVPVGAVSPDHVECRFALS